MDQGDQKDVRCQVLPAWLTAPSCYEPAHDKDAFLRKNVLSLTSALVRLRVGSAAPVSLLDRQLANVRPSLRLLATVLLVTLLSLSRNLAFAWVLLVGWLLVLASRPAELIRANLVPALALTAMAVLVNVPALLFGQPTAPLRMATKTLATVGLVMSLALSLGSDGLLAALRGLHVPASACMVVDLAVRDAIIMGESAVSLSEALALRSVGRDRTKTASAAGVLGAVFVRAHTMATARAEAMELRGYHGAASFVAMHASVRPQEVGYLVVAATLVCLFAYLELSLP